MREHLKNLASIAKKITDFLYHAIRKAWCIALRISNILFEFTKTHLQQGYNWLRPRLPFIRERLFQYSLLIRLDRPIGIFLLLWPTLWALWIASKGTPDPFLLAIFVFGVIVMRSAGCVINDLVDRDLDPHVVRTMNRPLASGKVTIKEAVLVTLFLLVIAIFLVLQLNPLTVKISFIAVILAIIYPFTKRYTYIPQLFLGLAFSCAIPMAFAAQTGELSLVTWMLFLTNVLWAVVYDTMYAMVDKEYDLKTGIKSTAILFEDADRTIIGLIQLLILLSLVLVGGRLELGRIYFSGLAIAALFSLYQQYLIKDRIPERCFAAFINNNWFGAAVFAGLFLEYFFG